MMSMHGAIRRTATISFVFTTLLAVALLFGAVSTAQAQSVGYTGEETKFLQLINDYRTSLGLGTLKVSDELSESGDRHDSDMGKYGYFGHFTQQSDWFANGAAPWDRMAASGYDYNTCKGENIAAGMDTAAKVFEAWKNSPDHNTNMINPQFKELGISLAYISGSTYGYYWTTDFGGTLDSTAHTLGSSVATDNGPFTDVGSGTPYVEQIKLLAQRGVVSGYGNGAFGPNDPVTRQQFAKMVVLALGRIVTPISSCSFRDVAANSSSSDPLYPASYIAVCAADGITVGKTPYTFCPYNNITRAQLITMVVRAAGLNDPPTGYQPPFRNFSDEHYPYARRAASAGWLDDFQGMGANFDFWAPATRSEVCLLLAALLGN